MGAGIIAGAKVPTSKRNDWLTKERTDKVSSQKKKFGVRAGR